MVEEWGEMCNFGEKFFEMAKKKAKNKGGNLSGKISPERFMKEKARDLPKGKCFVNNNWEEAGMASVVVSRIRKDGKIAACIFLVDTYCLGVKDVIIQTKLTDDEFDKMLNSVRGTFEYKEISYVEAHNLILGAIEFAEEGGVSPSKEYEVAQYILDEDTDDIPIIEYEYGKDGKHLLVAGPTGRDIIHIKTLKEKLGDDFDYVIPLGEGFDYDFDDDDEDVDDVDVDEEYVDEEYDDDDKYNGDKIVDALLKKADNKTVADLLNKMMDGFNKVKEEDLRNPDEVFAYDYPEYPQTLNLKNGFLEKMLKGKLTDKKEQKILALPKDELVEDLNQIILYTIGKTYKGIEDGAIEKIETNELYNSVTLLEDVADVRALDALLELLHQSRNFISLHFGDEVSEYFPDTLYECGKDCLDRLEAVLHEKGLDGFNRAIISRTIAKVAEEDESQRDKVIEIMRRELNFITPRLPQQDCCDALFAGLFVGHVMNLNATELLPEVEALYATDCVNKNICGDFETIRKELLNGSSF